MSDLFVFRPSDGDREEARRAREREQERLRTRYAERLATSTGIDAAVAGQITDFLFDHRDRAGHPCLCACHPRLSSEHGDGLDCRCTWSEERAAEERRRWNELLEAPELKELATRHVDEERAIATWLAWRPGVEARRLSSYAPEQWKGSVDGHSFYFRERHGEWRIELDLKPTGQTLERLVDVAEGGELVTEPVAATEGTVVAEGLSTVLGESPVDHLAFIVVRIREHLRAEACRHDGARLYCPDCGRRVG